MVRAIGDYLLENIDDIAQLLTLEAGKPLWESVVEIEVPPRYFEYYGNQAETLEGRSIPWARITTISPPMSPAVSRRKSSRGTIP